MANPTDAAAAEGSDDPLETCTIVDARLVTIDPPGAPPGPRRGEWLSRLGVIERGWISFGRHGIEALGPGVPPAVAGTVIDAAGGVVMPTLVDCHTHACFAGERYGEFAMRLAGRSYLEILAAGGGIMSTVRAVRAASQAELTANLRGRLRQMRRLGTGAVEVKSGYGLETAAELRMLAAIAEAASTSPAPVVPTFLGAHAIDPDDPAFIERTIEETLPAVANAFPGIACDAYCEQSAWPAEACIRLFERALSMGLPIRVHVDQFNALGLLEWAIEHGARSVDHLEATRPQDLPRIAASGTIAVLLPASGFSLDGRYAAGRELADLGAAIAIASNCNPGSAPSPSLSMAMALACRAMRLQPEEAIVAATHNAACVLGLEGRCGMLRPGMRADLMLLDGPDERSLGCEFALPGPRAISLGGRWIELSPPRLS
jgi:imidazolonepropionase